MRDFSKSAKETALQLAGLQTGSFSASKFPSISNDISDGSYQCSFRANWNCRAS